MGALPLAEARCYSINTPAIAAAIQHEMAPAVMAEAQRGDVASPVGGHAAQTADLDGDGGEVAEAAEGVGGDLGVAGADCSLFDHLAKVGVGDKLGHDDLLAQE